MRSSLLRPAGGLTRSYAYQPMLLAFMPAGRSSPAHGVGRPTLRSSKYSAFMDGNGTPLGQACTASSRQTRRTEPNTMFDKVILIGPPWTERRSQNHSEQQRLRASSTSQPRRAGTTRAITRPNRMTSCVCLEQSLEVSLRLSRRGQLITLEGTLRYREITEGVEGQPLKHRILESMPSA